MARIVFVNDKDEVMGAGSKEEAWGKGIFHRVVGIFIFNSHGDLLIQKRSSSVPTSPNLWDNKSAGGHVDEGEDYIDAAKRESKEELGIDNLQFEEAAKFFMKEVDEKGRIKNRFHMLYKTKYDGQVFSDENDVAEIRWISLDELKKWMHEKPKDFVESSLKSFQIVFGGSE